VVLENFYNVALRNDPNCRDVYLAVGSLALAKQDYKLAAERYQEALKRFGDDPDVHYGLAQAFYHSDRKSMIAALDAVLHVNPARASAVLLAEHQITRRPRRRPRQLGAGGQPGTGCLGLPGVLATWQRSQRQSPGPTR
jgi:tetratricopeptide (TPR) repeat protein